MKKVVSYFKILKNDIDHILKFTKEIYSLKVIYIISAKAKFYKDRYIPLNETNVIFSLELSSNHTGEELNLTGAYGRIFNVDVSFQNLSIFTYFTSLIISDGITQYFKNATTITFSDGRLTSELEATKNNYKWRNHIYQDKFNFNIEFNDEEKVTGRLLPTPIEQIKINTSIPSHFSFYNDSYALINDLIQCIDFANEKVLLMPNYDFDNFKTKIIEVTNASFKSSDIIGSDYPKYTDISWKELLSKLSRQDNLHINLIDLELRPNIDYYRSLEYRDNSNTDPWSIVVINDNPYITQGNHRSTLSKFLQSLDIIQLMLR